MDGLYFLSATGIWFWPPDTEFGDPELIGGIPIAECVKDDAEEERDEH